MVHRAWCFRFVRRKSYRPYCPLRSVVQRQRTVWDVTTTAALDSQVRFLSHPTGLNKQPPLQRQRHRWKCNDPIDHQEKPPHFWWDTSQHQQSRSWFSSFVSEDSTGNKTDGDVDNENIRDDRLANENATMNGQTEAENESKSETPDVASLHGEHHVLDDEDYDDEDAVFPVGFYEEDDDDDVDDDYDSSIVGEEIGKVKEPDPDTAFRRTEQIRARTTKADSDDTAFVVPNEQPSKNTTANKSKVNSSTKDTTTKRETSSENPKTKNKTTNTRISDKYAAFREAQQTRRTSRHTNYWKQHWQRIDPDRQRRTLNDIRTYLDSIVQRGGRVDALVAATKKIQSRAKLASDYSYDNDAETKTSSSSATGAASRCNLYSMGPLTLVLSTIRENTPPIKYEQKALIDFICHKTRATSQSCDSSTTSANTSSARKVDALDEDLADCLLRARYRALFLSPLFWGRPDLSELQHRRDAFQSKSPAERRQEAKTLATKLRTVLPLEFYRRVRWLLQNYVDSSNTSNGTTMKPSSASSSANGNALNGTHVSRTKTFTTSLESSNTIRQNQFNVPIRRLNKFLYRATSTHFHWIASDVARFFDYNYDSMTDDGDVNDANDDDNDKEDDSRGLEDRNEAGIVADDPFVIKAEQSWLRIRDAVAKVLMVIEQKLVHSLAEQKMFLVSADKESTRAENGETTSPEFSLNIEKLRREPERQEKVKNLSHFHFDSVQVDEEHQAIISTFPAPPYMVLVENLPIDVTEQDIDEWYSRCGSIKSISILNKQPDLDPGPLSEDEIKMRRKKAVRRSGRWTRPRSPVYGLIEFSEKSGYDMATQPGLCVFGMVLKRHDVRTIPSQTRLHTLFIENLNCHLPPSSSNPDENQQQSIMRAKDMESNLQKLLDPVWVTAASGQDGLDAIGSCQIQFPSFQISWWAYKTLTTTPGFQNVHWIRTPDDAIKWWTREEGFF
ncbi:hypothetical protein ACA910_013162 [Epithemia clementina (nom. ined.)]